MLKKVALIIFLSMLVTGTARAQNAIHIVNCDYDPDLKKDRDKRKKEKCDQALAEIKNMSESYTEIASFLSRTEVIKGAEAESLSKGNIQINEVSRYVNSAFLFSSDGKTMKGFIPSDILKSMATEDADLTPSVTVIGSGLGSKTVDSGGAIGATLEQTIFDYMFKTGKDHSFKILFFSFGKKGSSLERLSFKHIYNINGIGLRNKNVQKALANWAVSKNADDDDKILFIGNVGVREFMQERFGSSELKAGLTGWTYAEGGALYKEEEQAQLRRYHYSIELSDLTDVATIKFAAKSDKMLALELDNKIFTKNAEETNNILGAIQEVQNVN